MNTRNTIQRSLVLKAVKDLQNHPTADEIYNMIKEEHIDISKATVYRNLSTLTENGKIRKMNMISGHDRYDHLPYKHYHARCLECGCVFDIDMDIIHDLDRNVNDANGFKISDHDIIFSGTCKSCLNK